MDGQSLGIMPLRDAQQRAMDQGLDLVEVAPHAQPPVCQIMDYGKYKFDQSKKAKDQKKNNRPVLPKEVQVRPVTCEHDLQTKIAAIKKFIEEGRNVQVSCIFNKREVMFKDQGLQIIHRIMEAVTDVAIADGQPKFNEKRLQIRFRPR